MYIIRRKLSWENDKKQWASFSFSGTAANPGNPSINLAGVNTSIISLNLTNSAAITNGAVVTGVSTSGTQSPNQGNVHHMINPSSTSTWYTSKVTSASRGSYLIDIDDQFAAKQTWNFGYNALATVKSTMRSVKLTIDWQYDINQTDYQIFTS